MSKSLLFVVLLSIPALLAGKRYIPIPNTDPEYLIAYGEGDWHVYPHWIYTDDICLDFVDMENYNLAHLHVAYDAKSHRFDFLPSLDVFKCVSLIRYTDKVLLLHLYDVPGNNDLVQLSRFLGPEYHAVWLHYDLRSNWTGEFAVGPFEVVVLSLEDEARGPKEKYTEEDLNMFIDRVRRLPDRVKKAVQLHEKIVLASKDLDWKRLTSLVTYTIVYNPLKEHPEKKEALLKILQSPIAFTFWDNRVLKSYGRQSKYQNSKKPV